jgi:succinate dehydrogenase/fumarate reductase cytochrome b subunit
VRQRRTLQQLNGVRSCPEVPSMRFVVLAFIGFILFSLFSALYFLLKDKGQSTRTVKALTVRVALSIALFVVLLIGFKTGLITQRL